jgi:hypothetical protein
MVKVIPWPRVAEVGLTEERTRALVGFLGEFRKILVNTPRFPHTFGRPARETFEHADGNELELPCTGTRNQLTLLVLLPVSGKARCARRLSDLASHGASSLEHVWCVGCSEPD